MKTSDNQISFAKKRVLVIGLGLSGRSASQLLLHQEATVTGIDRNVGLLTFDQEIGILQAAGLVVQSDFDIQDVSAYDLVLISPGIPLTHPIVQTAKAHGIPIISEIELGCQFSAHGMLGVTGTNGKTTVTSLIAHVLQNASQPAYALGNIGIPLTQQVRHLDDQTTIVLELSSYQLETFSLPRLEAGVILNITPDHLDRHGSMENYALAKFRMENCLTENGQLYLQEKAWKDFGYLLNNQNVRLYGYNSSCFIYTDLRFVFRDGRRAFELPFSLQFKRSHHLENLLAAYAICSHQGIIDQDFIESYKSFLPLSHRIQFILENQGVRYYDDSKGTNIDAVTQAIQSLDGSIRLIAGGIDKGASYLPWTKFFDHKVKSICAIGQAADKIHTELSPYVSVLKCQSLEEAVNKATSQAKPGEIVLLSPGCSSFDMFKDYVHRGEEFQRIVRKNYSKGHLNND